MGDIDLSIHVVTPGGESIFVSMSAPVPVDVGAISALEGDLHEHLCLHIAGKLGSSLSEFELDTDKLSLRFDQRGPMQFKFDGDFVREWNWSLTRHEPFSWTQITGLVADDREIRYYE